CRVLLYEGAIRGADERGVCPGAARPRRPSPAFQEEGEREAQLGFVTRTLPAPRPRATPRQEFLCWHTCWFVPLDDDRGHSRLGHGNSSFVRRRRCCAEGAAVRPETIDRRWRPPEARREGGVRDLIP